ncbi:MAG: DNA polymerase IV [Tissierellia bacterium]|nr:DNA polymerase IV [Tissierellia bacterium]
MENHIVHVDIDAFYASVEELDNPTLKGKPLVVGGKSEQGIVTTANYEARKYGLHSAMPMFQARSLCDNLTIVPMRRKRYREKSREVFDVLHRYSPLIEKVSIDESYLDIRGQKEDGVTLVQNMQREVYQETGLTVSAGLSYNKFLAKLASDWNKPHGFKEIKRNEIPHILWPLPIRKVHGIGHRSEEKLKNLGIETVGDLYQLSEEFLVELFGRGGEELYQRIRGVDRRVVTIQRERKSLGTERTFPSTRDREVLKKYLENFSKEIAADLLERQIGAMTLTVKIKTWDFEIRTRSKTFDRVQIDPDDIFYNGITIFEELYQGEKIRLIGLTGSNLVDLKALQLSFFEV